jgi:hypothetical protein
MVFMKKSRVYSLAVLLAAVVMVSCNGGDDQSSDETQDSVNRTDTRRNTTDTVNTLPDTATLKVDTGQQDTGQIQ